MGRDKRRLLAEALKSRLHSPKLKKRIRPADISTTHTNVAGKLNISKVEENGKFSTFKAEPRGERYLLRGGSIATGRKNGKAYFL